MVTMYSILPLLIQSYCKQTTLPFTAEDVKNFYTANFSQFYFSNDMGTLDFMHT